MNSNDFRVGWMVAHSASPNDPVYRILEIFEDGTMKIVRKYGKQINTPYCATMYMYRKATDEQCRNAGLVT
jgi:hypothetical protein